LNFLENLRRNERNPNDIANFDDPLNLDGTIDPPGTEGKQRFNQQHVLINNGEIQPHSRRRFGESSAGDISSIPSYDGFGDMVNTGGPNAGGIQRQPQARGVPMLPVGISNN